MLKRVAFVLAGMIVGGLVVSAVEALGHAVYPPPEGMEAANPEAISAYIETGPLGAILFVPLAHALGALASGVVIALLLRGHERIPLMIAAGVWTAVSIGLALWIKPPLWFTVLDLLVYAPAVWLGWRLAGLGRSGAAA